jgi:hypothetical protein
VDGSVTEVVHAIVGLEKPAHRLEGQEGCSSELMSKGRNCRLSFWGRRSPVVQWGLELTDWRLNQTCRVS